MQPFQNFSMNNYPQYQPYQFPMMSNQYMDRLAQLQAQQVQQTQMQMPNQQPSIIGKTVNDFMEITANDVPMDGRYALFPKNDMTEIQVKTWGADGKIQTISYKPTISENVALAANNETMQVNLSDELIGAFMARFDDIAERLDKMDKLIKPTMTTRSKKEGNSDD